MNNKKIITVFMLVVLSLSLTGCKKKDNINSKSSEEPKAVEENLDLEKNNDEHKTEEVKTNEEDSVEDEPINEEIPTVTKVIAGNKVNLMNITIPADYLDEFEDIDRSILEKGVEKIERNEDGSLKMTLKEETYKKILVNMDNEIKNEFKSMTGSKDTPYIKKIESNKDYRNITVFMDKEAYENSFDLTPLVVAMKGAKYQSYRGLEVKVNVVVKDNKNGEIISSANYPEDLPAFNGQ